MTAMRPPRVLIAPDKFKGSLSAIEIAEAIRDAWLEVIPGSQIVLAPIADGGEGFSSALIHPLRGRWIERTSVDCLGQQIPSRYVLSGDQKTSVIEMSDCSGLFRIEKGSRKPLVANTFGTGIQIRDAIEKGSTRIIIGLGGSATTDAGLGLAAALGWPFVDAAGAMVQPEPHLFPQIRRIIPPTRDMSHVSFTAACDVTNPLLGTTGCAAVFAPQKGATADQVQQLEQALCHISSLMKEQLGTDFTATPGAGAAGGTAFGLLTFCRAQIVSGFDLVSDLLELPDRIRESDLVITGEGRLDAQSLSGKGPCGIAKTAKSLGIPVIAIAGSVENHAEIDALFDATFPIIDTITTLASAIEDARPALRRATRRAAALLKLGGNLRNHL